MKEIIKISEGQPPSDSCVDPPGQARHQCEHRGQDENCASVGQQCDRRTSCTSCVPNNHPLKLDTPGPAKASENDQGIVQGGQHGDDLALPHQLSGQGGSGQSVVDDLKTVSEIIEDLNKLSRQKSGGTFDPTFQRSKPNCILCSRGFTCLGPNCLGPPKTPSGSYKKLVTAPVGTFCPGLIGETTLPSLIELRLDEGCDKRCTRDSVLPFGWLFGWEKDRASSTSSQTSSSFSNKFSSAFKMSPSSNQNFSSLPKPTPRSNKKSGPSNHCSTDVYDTKVLQNFLRRCGSKTKSRKCSISKSVPLQTGKKTFPPELFSPVPGKEDMKAAPIRVQTAYKNYYKIKANFAKSGYTNEVVTKESQTVDPTVNTSTTTPLPVQTLCADISNLPTFLSSDDKMSSKLGLQLSQVTYNLTRISFKKRKNEFQSLSNTL